MCVCLSEAPQQRLEEAAVLRARLLPSVTHTNRFAYVSVPSNLGNVENLPLCPESGPPAVYGAGGTFYYVFMVFFHLAHIFDAMGLILLSVVDRCHR